MFTNVKKNTSSVLEYVAIEKVSGSFCAKLGMDKCRESRDFLNSQVREDDKIKWVTNRCTVCFSFYLLIFFSLFFFMCYLLRYKNSHVL